MKKFFPLVIKKAKKKKYRKTLLVGLFLLLALPLSAFYVFILRDLPSPTRLTNTALPQSTQIYDRHQTLLYTIYGNRNQTVVPLTKIPKSLQQATLAIEDKDFYRHGAVDLRGIVRAFINTVFKRELQGGSTLTQQLVKNSLLTPERTITRKIKEVILSFATEMLYSKDQILEMYLNQSPYGGTAWGVEAAAQMYFGKRVQNLTLEEATLIAGLPKAPTTFSPFGAYPELAKKRQREVLQKMKEQNYISESTRHEASQKSLQYQKVSDNIKAPHFVLYVKDLLMKKYGRAVVEEGGLRVTTTLDLPLQEFAEDTVASEVAKLKNSHVGNGAAVVSTPATGEILAMVGSKDYFNLDEDGNVNVTLANRQPGSSIKPINYAVGLAKGYTAATPFIDEPKCFPNPSGPPYCPLNYDRQWHGLIQMRFALGNSFNMPAVKMLKLNSVEAMIASASAMGIKSLKDPKRYGLSLTLGGGEVTMLEMATAFGVFANGGYRIDLYPILKITDSKGKMLEEYTPPHNPLFGKKVLPSGIAYIISHILLDNNARSQAFGTNSMLRINDEKKNPLPISVKTGTTNDYRDNWTIGYTPSVLVAVWVGNNDNSPMKGVVSGVSGAAPIWHTLMGHMVKDKPATWPLLPSTVIGKQICATSGLLPPPEGTENRCPTRFEYFIKGTEPKQTDPGKQKVFIDKATNDLAKEGQTDNVEEKEEFIVSDPLGDRYCLTCPHPTPSPTP